MLSLLSMTSLSCDPKITSITYKACHDSRSWPRSSRCSEALAHDISVCLMPVPSFHHLATNFRKSCNYSCHTPILLLTDLK